MYDEGETLHNRPELTGCVTAIVIEGELERERHQTGRGHQEAPTEALEHEKHDDKHHGRKPMLPGDKLHEVVKACQMAGPDCELLPVEKAVARTGALSYKRARLAVKSGRVTVDGGTAVLGLLVGVRAKLFLDAQPLPERVSPRGGWSARVPVPVSQTAWAVHSSAHAHVQEPLVYYMLNKPRACMSLAQDGPFKKSAEGGTVLDYVPACPRVFPVGRLDYDSEGLILLTNDGRQVMSRLMTR